jgi:hypothetical protein
MHFNQLKVLDLSYLGKLAKNAGRVTRKQELKNCLVKLTIAA